MTDQQSEKIEQLSLVVDREKRRADKCEASNDALAKENTRLKESFWSYCDGSDRERALEHQLTAWQQAFPEDSAETLRAKVTQAMSMLNEQIDKVRAWQQATGCETVEEYRERVDESNECGCPVHGGSVHGLEAERLRKGIERLIEHEANVDSDDLQTLLDETAACDSLGYLEHVECELQAKLVNTESRIATLEADLKAVNNAASIYREERDEERAEHAITRAQMASADAQRDAAQARCADFEAGMKAWKSAAEERHDEAFAEASRERDALRAQLDALTKSMAGAVVPREKALQAIAATIAEEAESACPKPLCVPSEECASECRADGA